MSTEAWKAFFDWGTVVLIGLTFVFGAGALITGKILSDRQDEQLRQFDKKLTDAKTELGKQEERAAKAETELKGLANKAGEANERAGALEVEARQLVAQNLETEGKLVAAQRALEEETTARVEVERSVASRRLYFKMSGGKTNVDVLKPFAGPDIIIQAVPDWEARRAASNLAWLLDKAGWKIMRLEIVDENIEDGVTVGTYLAPYTPSMQEERANVGAMRQTQQAGQQLAYFLNDAGWTAEAKLEKDVSKGTVRIRVGLKPSPFALDPQIQEMNKTVNEINKRMREQDERLRQQVQPPEPQKPK